MSRVIAQEQHKPMGVERFAVNGQNYAVHRFAEGKGPTLEGAISFAKGRGEMLTLEEARAIRDNPTANAAFRNVMKPGDWTYVRDSASEDRSWAAYLDRYWDWGLYALRVGRADGASRVVVLKETGREAAAPQGAVPSVPKTVIKDAERQLTKMERNPLINNEEISALRALVDAAKAQKRQ